VVKIPNKQSKVNHAYAVLWPCGISSSKQVFCL